MKEDFSPKDKIVLKDGTEIKTCRKQVENMNALYVEAGTTGHMGGDSGHGGRTFFKIADITSTDMRCVVCEGPEVHRFDHANSIEIILGGDSELDTFCEALRIGYKVLSREAGSVADITPTNKELRQDSFAQYINDLCELYRKTGSLKGMSAIRNKHHITGLTQQQFFECDLHHAKGWVNRDFCDKVYDFILDTTKAVPVPRYGE